MPVARLDCYLISTGPCPHMTIVMNDPVFSPEHNSNAVLVVNISSVDEDAPFDNACVLSSGHPFIKRDSYVYYANAVVVNSERLEKNIDAGDGKVLEQISEEIFEKVCAGFRTSDHVTPKIKRFIKNCAPSILTGS